MKFFQYIVKLRRVDGHFYRPVATHSFFAGIVSERMEDDTVVSVPFFGDVPVAYSRSIARLHTAELRRAGYNVVRIPYPLFALVGWIRARKSKKWK